MRKGEEINKAEVISKLFNFSIFFAVLNRADSVRVEKLKSGFLWSTEEININYIELKNQMTK